MFSLLASDQQLAEIFAVAGKSSELSGANRVRYYTFNSNFLRVYENAFLQKQQNVIDDAHWSGMTRMMIDYTKMVAFPQYWQDRKYWLSESFQDYMETEIIPAAQKSGINIPGNY
jgi:hypothetical protein